MNMEEKKELREIWSRSVRTILYPSIPEHRKKLNEMGIKTVFVNGHWDIAPADLEKIKSGSQVCR